jgi:hypothetical protein
MYTYIVDEMNILKIYDSLGSEIASHGPWENPDRAKAWAEKRIEYMTENPNWNNDDEE